MADKGDWISPWWQAACLPDRWDVCGVLVTALSCWHLFALEQIGNRYILGGAPTRDDAASLLLFARGGMEHGRRLLLNPQHRGRQMRAMYRVLSRVEMADLDAACADYVTTCTRTLSRWQRSDSKPCAVPYQWHIVRRVCRDYNVPLREAWDMPYALARCLYDVAAEADGDTSLMTVAAQHMEDTWQP